MTINPGPKQVEWQNMGIYILDTERAWWMSKVEKKLLGFYV
jgi:hypothetical protein